MSEESDYSYSIFILLIILLFLKSLKCVFYCFCKPIFCSPDSNCVCDDDESETHDRERLIPANYDDNLDSVQSRRQTSRQNAAVCCNCQNYLQSLRGCSNSNTSNSKSVQNQPNSNQITYENEILTQGPSSSINSSNILTGNLKNKIVQKMQNLQQAVTNEANYLATDEIVSQAQNLLLHSRNQDFFGGDGNHDHQRSSSSLIIGVHSNYGAFAGYCINLQDKLLHYYVIKKEDFPLTLAAADEGEGINEAEQEVTNLLFALMLWKDLILKHKNLQLYTESEAVAAENRFANQNGLKLFKLLSHFILCKNVRIENWENMQITKRSDLEGFAKYVAPARDLSNWKIKNGLDFLTNYHGIRKQSVLGTHLLNDDVRDKYTNAASSSSSSPITEAIYEQTEKYQEFIDVVNNEIKHHSCINHSCADIFKETKRTETD